MMRNKKGLSDVITTVLIVLLALAAVVIIWGFVRPALERGGEGITKQSVCFDVDIEPTGCEVSDNTVDYKNNGGQEVASVRVIAENTDTGETFVQSDAQGLTPYGSRADIALTEGTLTTDHTIRVAAIVTSEGQNYNCDPTPSVVNCVDSSPPGP